MMPNRTALMNSREQSSALQAAAAGQERKAKGALPATQLHRCARLL